MDERVPKTSAAPAGRRSARFELAPPRHFVLPAILLMLSEQPGYGYRLVKDLEDLQFGRIDRPSVYRALGQLENDRLVESWLEAPTAGQTRRVYGLTPLGGQVLRVWMGVIKEERDGLDRVLRRYQATGTHDAVLAEIDAVQPPPTARRPVGGRAVRRGLRQSRVGRRRARRGRRHGRRRRPGRPRGHRRHRRPGELVVRQ